VPDTLELDRPPDGVVVVRLKRPERLNTINEAMQTELGGALGDLAADRSVRAVVLTGAGRGFCAGIDMRPRGRRAGGDRPRPGPDALPGGHGRARRGRTSVAAAVIAAVNGHASARGSRLLRLRAAAEAKFADKLAGIPRGYTDLVTPT
jgi:enoyl-CoA hydratase